MKKGTYAIVTTLPKCDFCDKKANYDFKTLQGPWANGCPNHYIQWRMFRELGIGKGQQLVLTDPEDIKKIKT